ncbi:aldehyde oxidoreductase [Haladaptatus sp. W1]|uniref:aldo/keto reductase n=1 Tax=Haladaptatus sp. W1 TaxID=1897478 RepID=UPI0008498931|nr:aldo/keto reductase [Haladaptatus sp. W1]ODR81840.1 aldehyde oxidoreductase [Haladaptatus sp. W1]
MTYDANSDGIPKLGLGTWENTDSGECAHSVAYALDLGYEHVDTAQAYGNEENVGRGIADSSVDREDFFLATKVWIDNLAHDDVLETAEKSLDKLGTDYVDLLYVHWPAREYDPEETLAAFDDLYDEGKIKHVGLSNFEPEHLEEAKEILDAPIYANQVEMHPLLQQDELVEYAQENDITLVAYSPLARGNVFNVPELTDIAEKHETSEAQVSLAWLMQKDNVVAIPKATGEDHIEDNYGALTLELDDEDIEKIDDIEREERQVDPDFGPWN